MNTLHDMINISKVIEGKLIEVGIETPQSLEELGSKGAFRRLKHNDPTVCVNMLCALEGALRGIRWHNLPDEVKQDLRDFYKTL